MYVEVWVLLFIYNYQYLFQLCYVKSLSETAVRPVTLEFIADLPFVQIAQIEQLSHGEVGCLWVRLAFGKLFTHLADFLILFEDFSPLLVYFSFILRFFNTCR